MDRQYYDHNEIEIDLTDLCRVFLKNIKWIVLAGVIGLAVGLGAAAAEKRPTPLSAEEKKEAVLKSLSDSEIAYVEGLYYSIDALQKNVISCQDQLDGLQATVEDPTDNVMKQVAYTIDSELYGMNELFSTYMLSSDDYRALSEILYGTPDQFDKTNKRVVLYAGSDSRSFWTGTADVSAELEPITVFHVRVIAETKEKADQAAAYVENTLMKKQASYDAVNAGFRIEKLDEWYSESKDEIISKLVTFTTAVTRDMYNSEYQMNVLNTNYVSKLTGNSKSYYEILNGTYRESAAKSRNYRKYGLLGLLVGLFAALGWICLRYVLSDSVKTASELSWVLNGDLPYDLSAEGKKNKSADAAGLAAADLLIKEARNDVKKLYVITDANTENNADLQAVIKGLGAGASVKCGDPLTSAEALRELSEADGAVITAALKHRKRSEISQLEQYCRNGGVKILGVIAL